LQCAFKPKYNFVFCIVLTFAIFLANKRLHNRFLIELLRKQRKLEQRFPKYIREKNRPTNLPNDNYDSVWLHPPVPNTSALERRGWEMQWLLGNLMSLVAATLRSLYVCRYASNEVIVFTKPYRLYAVYAMRPIAAYVAPSVVCVFLRLSVSQC